MKHGFNNDRLFDDVMDMALHPYYEEWHQPMETILTCSRDPIVTADPAKNWFMQQVIYHAIEQTDYAVHEGRKMPGNREQFLQNMRNDCIASGFRTIADGMAWRVLGYDEFVIRTLAQAHSPGKLWGKTGRPAEFKVAERAVRNGKFAIMNDITNMLRVGDIVAVDPNMPGPGSIYIADTKLRGQKHIEVLTADSLQAKAARGEPLTKQEKRLVQAQWSIDNRMRIVGDEPEGVLVVTAQQAPDKLRKAKQALAQAAIEGVYDGFLTPYLHMWAVDFTQPRCNDHFDEMRASKESRKPMEELLSRTSYEDIAANMGGRASRGKIPTTLLPFDARTTVKLLLGELYVETTLYAEPLTKAFKKLGWEFRFDGEFMDNFVAPSGADNVAQYASEQLFPEDNSIPPEVMMLKHMASDFWLPVRSKTFQMLHEYTTVENVVAYAEAVRLATDRHRPIALHIDDRADTARREATHKRVEAPADWPA